MYDAKLENKDEDKLKYACISDSSYFSDLKCESILNMKSIHVPIDINNTQNK